MRFLRAALLILMFSGLDVPLTRADSLAEPLAEPLATANAGALAEPQEPSSGPPPGKGPLTAGGYQHGFRTGIDGGGSFATSTGFAAGQIGYPVGEGYILGGQLAWQGDWYSFFGQNGVTLPDQNRPWGTIQSFAASVSLGRRFGDWWVNGAFTTRFSYEDGASLGESFNPGGILAAQYTFSPRLKLGGGVLVNARMEEDPLIIPIPFVYWEIIDDLVLSNSIAPDAYPRGPGLEIAWRPNPTWAVAVGGRWEYRRFRLNNSGPEIRSGGVGEDEGVPLWVRVTWRLGDHLRADVLGGASVANRLRLADASGDIIRSVGTDSIPYVGAFLSYRF
ncbi:MAG: hypothetical protein P8K76_05615 [Candidatus Binatia bacterium]|nr:hypothetical protein [Candidatus Binatia bacterium]MDG1958307.1 hypothetical protein [Candidatus Binatia bacterium]MDG2009234.1 hypothetical protein [Candidatus Binatia bacterium]